MFEFASLDLVDLVVPHSLKEWNRWKVAGKILSSHPNLDTTLPRRTGPRDASNCLNS